MGTAISGEEPTDQLKQKARNIDRQLLEYKASEDLYGASSSANVQWDNLISGKSRNDLLEESLDPNNNRLSHDPCVQRVTYIVNQYNTIQRNKSSPYAFITGLKSYSLVQLLNDWIHLKSVYVDNKYESGNLNTSAIWDYLNMSLNESEESEDIYTRNMRDKSVLSETATRKDVYNGFSDSRNVVSIHILDAIHCYFYHGEPVQDSDKKLIKQKREWEVQCGVRAQLKNVSTMMSNATDTDDNKDPNQAQKLLKQKRNNLLFGEQFFYWDYFEGDAFFCRARYNSLKSEILRNNIFNLSELQYADVLLQSELWHQSIIGQFCTAFNRGGGGGSDTGINEQYDIEAGLPLTVAHIMAIVLFTSYELLAYKYINRGCNKLAATEAYRDTQRRNTEIGIWYRLMKEAVLFYGEMSRASDCFYHSIESHLLFGSVAPAINAPLIVSTSLAAASIITESSGAVIHYKQHSSLDNAFMDISYCSPFSHRDLKLFAEASVLDIRDIFVTNEFGQIVSHREYVQGMLIFQRMIHGQYCRNLCDSVAHQYQKAVLQLMDNELAADRSKRGATYAIRTNVVSNFEGFEENGVRRYIQALFSFMIRESTEMWIIQSEYESAISAELRNYLLTLHDNAFKPFTVLWNKRLRQTMGSELAFKWVNEYTWQLDNEDIAEFNELKHAEMMDGPELQLHKTQDNPDGFVIKVRLAKTYSSSKGLGAFGVSLCKLPKNCSRVQLGWNVYCADANDFIMSTPATVMYKGDTTAYATFPPQAVANKQSITFKICIKISQ